MSALQSPHILHGRCTNGHFSAPAQSCTAVQPVQETCGKTVGKPRLFWIDRAAAHKPCACQSCTHGTPHYRGVQGVQWEVLCDQISLRCFGHSQPSRALAEPFAAAVKEFAPPAATRGRRFARRRVPLNVSGPVSLALGALCGSCSVLSGRVRPCVCFLRAQGRFFRKLVAEHRPSVANVRTPNRFASGRFAGPDLAVGYARGRPHFSIRSPGVLNHVRH